MSHRPAIAPMAINAKTLIPSVLSALCLLRHPPPPSTFPDATLQNISTSPRQLRGWLQHKTTATDVVRPPQKLRRQAAISLRRRIPLRMARRGQPAMHEIANQPRIWSCNREVCRICLKPLRPLRALGRLRSLRISRSTHPSPSPSRALGPCWSIASTTQGWT